MVKRKTTFEHPWSVRMNFLVQRVALQAQNYANTMIAEDSRTSRECSFTE